ncbi:Integrase core domain-containing protein [Granulicatella balaenopterae]|uniref:Integrase core domain-containing protein n=1 Tax=Granulicatella balaenopterae TaxID=137733 RepID=A0A1H9NWV2_9LACT|nr:integrase core domain-containing protein [Granulicatella balaenopterae]SER40351.1 Integrase core domain-containing protein [Granulicatella balaenopterae]
MGTYGYELKRKRVCSIVDEKSVTHTAANFLKDLDKKFWFSIKTVQTDNGREFTNDMNQTEQLSYFERVLKVKGIQYKKTRPYSPWQNVKVERSHRVDGERFYNKAFKSLDDLINKHKRYIERGNNVARKILGFKSANQVNEEFWHCMA